MQKFNKDTSESGIPEVDIYFLKYNEEKQERLSKIRAIAKEKYPNSTERIYYGIPTE